MPGKVKVKRPTIVKRVNQIKKGVSSIKKAFSTRTIGRGARMRTIQKSKSR